MAKSLQDLLKQQEALQAEIEKLRAEEREEVIASIRAQIAIYGLSAADIGLGITEARRSPQKASKAVSGGSSVAPKYRNPVNYNQTWSGRGRKPQWFETFIANGGDVEKILIK